MKYFVATPKFFFLVALAALATVFTACNLLGGGGGGGRGGGLTKMDAVQYQVSGDQIIFFGKDYDCDYNSLTGDYDTLTIRNYQDTSTFAIQGNILTIIRNPFTVPPAAKIQLKTILIRVGTGSGLQGEWKDSGVSYQVVSGVLDSTFRKELDEIFERNTIARSYGTLEYNFSTDSMFVFGDARLAEFFVAEWNGEFDIQSSQVSDSAEYNITLQVVDKITVVLKGNKNAETVRLTLSQNGDKTYVSDNPIHAEYHFIADQPPQNCTDLNRGGQPGWWEDFLSANLRSTTTLAKTAAKPVIPSFRRPFTFVNVFQHVE